MGAKPSSKGKARQPRRWWLRVLAGAAIIVVVLFAVALGIIATVDWSKYAATVQAAVKDATGRELVLGGSVKTGIFPPRLLIEDVAFGNARWGSRREMVKAKRVEVRTALLPLLAGSIRLKVDLVEADLLLETDAKGVGNWEFGEVAAKPASGGKGALPDVDLEWLRLTQATFQYRDGRTKKVRRIAVDEGLVREKGFSGREITLKLSVDGVPVTLAATTDAPVLPALVRGLPLGLTLEARTTGASMRAEGRMTLSGGAASGKMKLSAEIDDTQRLARVAGIGLPKLPPLKLAGEFDGRKNIYALRKFQWSAGKSSASGELAADMSGARPKISGMLASPFLDLTEILPGTGTGKVAAGNTGRVFPQEPLPLDALNAVDATVQLKVARFIVTRQFVAEQVSGEIALAGGRLRIDSLTAKAGGGDVRAAGQLDASRGKSAQFNLSLTGAGIELGRIAAALGHPDEVSGGLTEVKADLRGTGASVAALAGSLSGHARVVTRSARVKRGLVEQMGADVMVQILNAVNPARKTEPYTDVQCLVVNVPIQGGVVTIDRTVALETPQVGMSAAGTIHLGHETLDLSVRPNAKEGIGIGVGGLASLVKIRGTLAKPTVGIDAAGAAGAAAQVGIGMMTGGLSILAKGLYDKSTTDAPCETALRGPRSAAAAPAQAAKKEDKASSGGFFDRLFR
ncbi:MAG: AsmA family protein [Betaproteobacteria bacterium]|nr:AsmA family protein [Betaproteobacteria bacterium]